MAGVIGSVGPFDESMEQWSCYTEPFDYFNTASGIANEKFVHTFLSVISPKTFNLLCNFLKPDKPGSKTYKEIMDTLTKHFSPKPFAIAERFKFHNPSKSQRI